jgi:hypothetical protein
VSMACEANLRTIWTLVGPRSTNRPTVCVRGNNSGKCAISWSGILWFCHKYQRSDRDVRDFTDGGTSINAFWRSDLAEERGKS